MSLYRAILLLLCLSYSCKVLAQVNDVCATMKKDSIPQALYTIETIFDEDLVTPFHLFRQLSLNPDYKYDNFSLGLQIEAIGVDAGSFVRWVLVGGDTTAYESVRIPGVSLFFNDGDSLVLDSLVDYIYLNNHKPVLVAGVSLDKSNIGRFLTKEIIAFTLVGRMRQLTKVESRYLRETVRCAVNKKPLE